MQQLEPGVGAGITDENVAQSAALVRALVVKRLEQAWRACDPHIQVQVNPDTGLVMRPDPRFIEAGIRIIDRLSSLYRLNLVQLGNGPDIDTDRHAIQARILEQVQEMETRLREREEDS